MTPRRSAIAVLAAFVTGVAAIGAAAQGFPSKPIRFMVGFPPGGGGDVIARIVAMPLSELLGQSVVVENKPGATGTLAAGIVAKSPPDGYTLLVGATSTNAIAPALYSQLPYDNEKDLVELPAEVKSDMTFYAIDTLDDVVPRLFPGPKARKATPSRGKAKLSPRRLTPPRDRVKPSVVDSFAFEHS